MLSESCAHLLQTLNFGVQSGRSLLASGEKGSKVTDPEHPPCLDHRAPQSVGSAKSQRFERQRFETKQGCCVHKG